ncbi:hypothetical protein [Burkholderia sp. Bp8992]|uniref:hypothetical protein n=1 Tax=Burkholderia sp. Bp8992 TaxID=2184554 RepID=UPI000F572CDA|nr:hypothetical protein [Burkholderia sp. Bp8992]
MTLRASLLGLLLLLGLSTAPAHAGLTLNHCEETFYRRIGPANATRPYIFYDEHDTFEAGPTTRCRARSSDMHGADFAVVDNRAYYVRTFDFSGKPECGRTTIGGGPIFDPPGCFVPESLRVVSNRRQVNYYPISERGAQFRLIDDAASDPAPRNELSRASYATDGVSVFRAAEDFEGTSAIRGPVVMRIEGADPETFHTFLPAGVRLRTDWARDSRHLYYGGNPIAGIAPNARVDFYGDELAVIGNRVYGFDYAGIHARPDVRPTLKMLSPDFITDGSHVFLRTGELATGFHPADFRILQPACPVPGHPDLKCLQEKPHVSDATQTHVAVGGGALLFDSGPAPVRINGVDTKRVVYFKVAGAGGQYYYLALSGRDLYLLDGHQGDRPYRPLTVSGPLRGPDADGWLSFDGGRLWVYSGTWH